MTTTNKALVFKAFAESVPVPGEHLQVEDARYGSDVATPRNGLVLKTLFASFDPFLRVRMTDMGRSSLVPPFAVNEPIDTFVAARVIRSNHPAWKEGDEVLGSLPIQNYIALGEDSISSIRKLEKPLGLEDLSLFVGVLDIVGLTAYSALYEIGKPKKGETIFVSSAGGAIGQLVGQLAKREGLKVIGSVGSDAKVNSLVTDLGFDGGFNYKLEDPAIALQRLAPEGIDIYYDNVGGEVLDAALGNMKDLGRVISCGLLSTYNGGSFTIKNFHNILHKRLTVRGFTVLDPAFSGPYKEEHFIRVSQWIKDGSLQPHAFVTEGIEGAAEGFVAFLRREGMGKGILKF